jgi:uncharacterized membrane protein
VYTNETEEARFPNAEALFSVNDLSVGVNKVDLPIASIVITFSVFMTVVLSVYFYLLKQEMKLEKEAKKVRMLEVEEETHSNAYSEKFNFLEKQQVSVSTLK